MNNIYNNQLSVMVCNFLAEVFKISYDPTDIIKFMLSVNYSFLIEFTKNLKEEYKDRVFFMIKEDYLNLINDVEESNNLIRE